MAWKIEFEKSAERELEKLGQEAVRRIARFLNERIRSSEDPRFIGQALKGSRFGELWKYRVGSYRIIAHIDDGAFRVLVVKVGNRRDIYRR